MIPAAFDYVRARTVRDALNALAAGDGSKLLAGGHSLLPMMRFRLAQPSRLVDIGELAELRGISEKGRGLRIGATTTYRELLDSPLVAERAPLLAEACRTIGDVQVRNRGTIGGGVAHADPSSDMPAVLLALDARIQLRSKTAKRAVPARGFFQGPFTTAMTPDELLTEIVVPPLPRGAATAYLSFEQAASGYPLVGVAAVVTLSRKTVTHCVVALTGVSDRAFLAASAASLVGTRGDAAALGLAADAALEGVTVNSDIHAPAEYRAHLARVAVRRALGQALERAR
jgi:carbon-monoxide dehydrogenase medium subunit